MNFTEVLRALAEGKIVRRPGSIVLAMSYRTFPVMTSGLVNSITVDTPVPISNNWFLQKYPVLLDTNMPYGFTEADIVATDWEVFE